MSDLFHVSAAPHKRSPITTKSLMLDVIIALIPAGIFGVYNFGINALTLIIICVLACTLTEYFYCKIMRKPSTAGDLS
ncbi:MAG: RnfABCDGE type electron transport complex subunit D, partial [Mobilitalea sp.]